MNSRWHLMRFIMINETDGLISLFWNSSHLKEIFLIFKSTDGIFCI